MKSVFPKINPKDREKIDKQKVIQCLDVIGDQKVQFINQATEFLNS